MIFILYCAVALPQDGISDTNQPPAAPGQTRPEGQVMIPWHYQPPWDPYEYRQRQQRKWKEDFRRWLKQFGALCSLSLFLYLILSITMMLIFSSEIIDNLFTRESWLFIIIPTVIPILNISGGTLVLYYLFLAGAIIISYLVLIGKSVPTIIREIGQGKPAKHSPMLMVAGLFFALFFFQVVYYIVISVGGISPTVPDTGSDPFWERVYVLAQASVWEEVIARILLIGIPLLWIDILFRRKDLQRPHKYLFGGGLKLGPVEVGLIVFSALMFGFAHVSSWDIWKIMPTAVGGLVLGYVFVTVGVYGAVMIHFATDFIGITSTYIGAVHDSWLGPLTIIWLVAGAMFFVYYSLRLKNFILRKDRKHGQTEHQSAQFARQY